MATTAAAGSRRRLSQPSRSKPSVLHHLPLLSSWFLRSYCRDCLNILVGAGTFDSLKDLDPWICYLCQPQQPHGALLPRADWSIRVQELFVNDSSIAFVRGRLIMTNLLICDCM